MERFVKRTTARSQNLVKSEDGTNARLVSFLCNQHSIEECFKPGFFDNISSNLLPGDQIRCVQITNAQKDKDRVVTASWLGIVIKIVKESNRKEKVIFVPIDKQGLQRYEVPEEKEEEIEPYVGPQFIQGDGVVERNKNAGDYTVKLRGKEVCTVESKKEASAIARGDIPIPEQPTF